MKNSAKIILAFLITIIIASSIIIGFYILGSLLKEGLFELGLNINNGLRNFPIAQ